MLYAVSILQVFKTQTGYAKCLVEIRREMPWWEPERYEYKSTLCETSPVERDNEPNSPSTRNRGMSFVLVTSSLRITQARPNNKRGDTVFHICGLLSSKLRSTHMHHFSGSSRPADSQNDNMNSDHIQCQWVVRRCYHLWYVEAILDVKRNDKTTKRVCGGKTYKF